jgi:peptide/nickel transport system substrate-binding protein
MRVDREPFTDERVRQAMKWVVDRDVMVKATVGDFGSVGNDHPVAPAFPLHTPLPLRERDPEKAKALLAEAGYPDGIDVELYAPNGRPPIVQQALAFQDMAEAGGIRVIIKTEPWHVWVGTDDEIEVTCGITNWSSRSVPGQVLNLHYHCDATWNIQAWCDEEYSDLVDQSDKELDFDKRKEMYKQIEQIFHDRGPVVISYFKGEASVASNKVQNFAQHPLVYWGRLRETWLKEA